MKLPINPESGVPIYLQLEEGLKDAIAAGILLPGAEVPSVRTMSAELRVNYHTVARAYRDLEAEGILVRRRGEPYRVAAGAIETSGDQLLREEIDRLIQRARSMGLSDDELLYRIQTVLSEHSTHAELA